LKEAIEPDADNDKIERLGTTAGARVEQYAPVAPDATRTDALIMSARYLNKAARENFLK